MLNVKKEQTMQDAHDALIFLAPLNNLHLSANIKFIYTKAFKEELKRRIVILYEADLKSFLKENNSISIEEYIERLATFKPQQKNRYLSE